MKTVRSNLVIFFYHYFTYKIHLLSLENALLHFAECIEFYLIFFMLNLGACNS